MADFSPLTVTVDFPLPAYLRDHRLGGRSVLPAVDALRILADTAGKSMPPANIRHMRDIALIRLLSIPPDDSRCRLFVTLAPAHGPDGVAASLCTRFRSKSGRITRLKTHVSVIFGGPPPPAAPLPDRPPRTGFDVDAARLYRELVPFGPGFQSLTGTVTLSPEGATGTAMTPPKTVSIGGPTGSPFPLDAAFHAACAWGQRFHHKIVYPMAITRRVITTPTAVDGRYAVTVRPVAAGNDTLTFDIWITSAAGIVCETVRGVRMAPIDGISTDPPAWISAPC